MQPNPLTLSSERSSRIEGRCFDTPLARLLSMSVKENAR